MIPNSLLRNSMATAAKATKKTTAAAADANAARLAGHGEGFHQGYSAVEGATAAASLADEGTELLSKASPTVEKALGVLGSGSSAASTVGKVVGGAAKAAPWLAAGNMVMQGVDVAKDPEANKQEVMGLSDKGVLERAGYGFMNPVKAIAGVGQAVGELASTAYDAYVEAPKREQALASRLENEKEQRLASRTQKAQNYLASAY